MDINKIFNIITIEKRNIFLHAPGGTGKSYTLQRLALKLKSHSLNFKCTATTGIAAINLNNAPFEIYGSTLHSWTGVGLAKESKELLLSKIYQKRNKINRWKFIQYLIIDEISMLGQNLFEKLDYIAKNIRGNDLPFGGIKLILSGDFLQLPPVNDNWIFNSKLWYDLNVLPIVFFEPKRFSDKNYFKLLNRVREKKYTKNDIVTINSRVINFNDKVSDNFNLKSLDVLPTILYSHKANVNNYNLSEMDKLDSKEYVFKSYDSFRTIPQKNSSNFKIYKENYFRLLDDVIPNIIRLKIGSQVMLKVNIDISEELVNGSRGVITDIDYENRAISVKFVGNKVVVIKDNVWEHGDDYGVAARSQIPLILAWALTIHKSQGSTLDFVSCNLDSRVFSPGQAYVALSRSRSLDGLYISNFHLNSIKVDEEALKYSRELSREYLIYYLENININSINNLKLMVYTLHTKCDNVDYYNKLKSVIKEIIEKAWIYTKKVKCFVCANKSMFQNIISTNTNIDNNLINNIDNNLINNIDNNLINNIDNSNDNSNDNLINDGDSGYYMKMKNKYSKMNNGYFIELDRECYNLYKEHINNELFNEIDKYIK